jgi:hypothetical protein
MKRTDKVRRLIGVPHHRRKFDQFIEQFSYGLIRKSGEC